MITEVASAIAETERLQFGPEPCWLRKTLLTHNSFPSRCFANLEDIRLARLNGNIIGPCLANDVAQFGSAIYLGKHEPLSTNSHVSYQR
jgi:hypothetical protein